MGQLVFQSTYGLGAVTLLLVVLMFAATSFGYIIGRLQWWYLVGVIVAMWLSISAILWPLTGAPWAAAIATTLVTVASATVRACHHRFIREHRLESIERDAQGDMPPTSRLHSP
ncbi:hypothetical protein ASG76_13330 [Nocardioides sp. Soil774]|uniref:hypothetical protein n=1 Tax=Nocardioides sp. Soil774 TaxID=1736408 RepID=UPI0006F609F0|nr:hypothetical protein [Nocardioides sp. Soil774]KRE93439.1 hypothetical protein ASG76_13330 [Nocardioides sp. Soil774]